MPMVLGAAVAWYEGYPFLGGYFLLTLLGAVLLHAGTNLANDYYDHKSGADDINTEFVRPFTGGSRMIQRGLLSPKAIHRGALVCFALGALIGIYLALSRGPLIWIFGIIGIISGYFYTTPIFFWAARGIGELLVGLNFGVLITLGSYYVQTQTLSWAAFWTSLPLAILILLVLFINEFQDARADEAVGKNHLVVRLGKRKAASLYAVLFLLAYGIILVGVALRYLSAFTLLTLLTVPLALKAIGRTRHFYDRHLELIPANATTILMHGLLGLLLSIGFVVDRLV